MTLPICLPGGQFNLGVVTFPASCAALPALPVNVAAPVDLGGGSWSFPVTGIYYWQSDVADGLVMVRSNSLTGTADLALQITAAVGDGTADESNYYWANAAAETERLFTEPGNRAWNCGPQADCMRRILAAVNIQARHVQWLSTINGSHQNCEVNLGAEGGWTLHDPHYGLVYMAGFDALDLFTRNLAGQPSGAYLRRWQPEHFAALPPWSSLDGEEMAMGLFVGNPVPMVAKPGVTLAQVKALMGDYVPVLKTTAQMRAAYY